MAGKVNHRGFGHVRKLPSGRYQASYVGPDMLRHNARETFQTKGDAERWLGSEQAVVASGAWTSPAARVAAKSRVQTFGQYAERWMARRDLKPRTRDHYRSLLERSILPTFGEMPLRSITSEAVRDWHADLDRRRPTLRAHAYGLLRTILVTAVADEKIPANPCHIRGAGTTKRARKIRPATLTELEVIAANMPERYRSMVLLSSWCGLRFGEVTELRRKDIDLTNHVIRVRRGVVRTEGHTVVDKPKTDAGMRDVAIPPHLVPMLKAHRDAMPLRGADQLLFPAADGVSHLAPSTLYRHFYTARKAAGRPDLRWHDLRHTGAVLAAQTGATLAELMGRLGHSTPAAAMTYQHIAGGRDAEIARALSRLAEGPA
jgi:integrase